MLMTSSHSFIRAVVAGCKNSTRPNDRVLFLHPYPIFGPWPGAKIAPLSHFWPWPGAKIAPVGKFCTRVRVSNKAMHPHVLTKKYGRGTTHIDRKTRKDQTISKERTTSIGRQRHWNEGVGRLAPSTDSRRCGFSSSISNIYLI